MNPWPDNPSHGDVFELNGQVYVYWNADGGGGWMQAKMRRPTTADIITDLRRMRAELSR